MEIDSVAIYDSSSVWPYVARTARCGLHTDARYASGSQIGMYTHWACFDCRKSFSKEASDTPRKCPDCAELMIDMGPYFEPPRKAAVKRWQVMKVLADNDLRFNSKDAKGLIDRRILVVKNPRAVDVIERIEDERRRNERFE